MRQKILFTYVKKIASLSVYVIFILSLIPKFHKVIFS